MRRFCVQIHDILYKMYRAFTECGVPDAMLMDHGIPWWSEAAPTGATWLTVWLMKQGIRLHWSGYRHPQTQGHGWMPTGGNITMCVLMKPWG